MPQGIYPFVELALTLGRMVHTVNLFFARLALALRVKSYSTAKVPLGQSLASRPIGTPAGKLREESPKPR